LRGLFPGTAGGTARLRAASGIGLILAWLSVPCSAQQRPLQTDDPEILGVGRVRIDAGIDYLQSYRFPLSGLKGDLTRLGVIGLRVGAGEYAEFQISGVIQDFLSITQRSEPVIPPSFHGNATSDFGDLTLAAKLKLSGERPRKPGLAFKFAVQLPNESNESGLGTDETRFFAALLASKKLARAQWIANLGLAILGSPVIPNTQADKRTYVLAVIIPVHRRLNLVGDATGMKGPQRVGNEDRAQARLGLQFSSGSIRWDVAAVAGLERYDPSSGVSVGFTYEFQAFAKPRRPKTVK